LEQLKLKFCGFDRKWVVFGTFLDHNSHFVHKKCVLISYFWSSCEKDLPSIEFGLFSFDFFGLGSKIGRFRIILDKNGAWKLSFLNSYFWSNCELDIPWIEFGIFRILISRFRSKTGRFGTIFDKNGNFMLKICHFWTVIFGQIVNTIYPYLNEEHFLLKFCDFGRKRSFFEWFL